MKKLFLIIALVGVMMVSGTSLVYAAEGSEGGDTIISPFWKTGSGTAGMFTYVAVSVPSTASAPTSRTINVTAVNSSGAEVGSYTGSIARGGTVEVYILSTTHSYYSSVTNKIGSSNAAAKTGHVRITTPHGAYAHEVIAWGAVLLPSNFDSGFAMEFIGDKTDSNTTSTGESGL